MTARYQPDAQALADASMTTEAAFQVHVVGLLRRYGWKSYHTRDSRRSDPGFPDLVAVRAGRLLAIELKTLRGRATEEQMAWLTALNEVEQVDAFILRPPRDGDWAEFVRMIR